MKKEEVLALGQAAPEAMPGDYVDTPIPTDAPPGSLRVVDKDLKTKLVNVRAAFAIQSPIGNPNQGGPNAKRPYIVQLYPNFDAPEKPKGPSRAPRGSGGGNRNNQPALPGLDTYETGDVVTGKYLVTTEDWNAVKANLRAYAAEVGPDAQREWQRAQQRDFDAAKKEAMTLPPDLFFDRIMELQQRFDFKLGFENYMKEKYGAGVVKVLGIPEVGPDRKDEKPPQGNGPLTPPKRGGSGSKK
jgi:hypothetical protein